MDYEKGLEQQNEELKQKLAVFENLNVLKIPTLDNEWTDRDHLMLHAVFAVLSDFIEGEWHGECDQYSKETIKAADKDEREILMKQNKEKKELWKLYRWWKDDFPELDKSAKWHIDGYEIETKKMIRVLELRGYMWT